MTVILFLIFFVGVAAETVNSPVWGHEMFKNSNSYAKLGSNGINERPLIGILSIPTPEILQKQFQWAQSYIPSSYVKFVEMAGARAVPVLISRNDTYYSNLFNSINGLLFPGDSVPDGDYQYLKAATTLFNLAKEANDKKDYFPIWGICLGFETLATLLSPKQTSLFTSCSAQDLSLSLTLSSNFSQSRMFKNTPQDVLNFLKTEKVTSNFHSKCLTPDNAAKSGLLQGIINPLSSNKDSDGVEFVSTYESIKYPFYGVQWNPEKNPFEWSTKVKNIPHTADAIRVTQYFANFFVSEARQNNHKFPTEDDEDKVLINNFHTFFTVKSQTLFTEVYLFHKTTKFEPNTMYVVLRN